MRRTSSFLSLSLCDEERPYDRKLVKSTFNCPLACSSLSPPLSPGALASFCARARPHEFIRSEGRIYTRPRVIYRFRWRARYRYTRISIRPSLFFFQPSEVAERERRRSKETAGEVRQHGGLSRKAEAQVHLKRRHLGCRPCQITVHW